MENLRVNLSKYSSTFGAKNKIKRLIWNIFYIILFRPFSYNKFNNWRSFILKLFDAKIEKGAIIYASVRIWAPWNLEMGVNSCLGPKVDCYNQGKILIGNNTVISQKSYLCASTHDYTHPEFPLLCKPIVIGSQVWIAADSFIGPGVCIGEGAVIGARSAVFKDVQGWTVVGGNPAVFIKKRIIL
jgi:putative colanic acid biosynthesis acetyltransferase WcaF